MSFTIKYNKTTNHIEGLTIRTASTGDSTDYAESACGALTRGRFATGKTFETAAEALAAAKIAGGRKVCATCTKAALAS